MGARWQAIIYEVSILVLLEVSLRPLLLCEQSQYSRVSILVLLEVSLRQPSMSPKIFGIFCFNPCFIGSISEASPALQKVVTVDLFQSLFYWKYL